MTGKTFPNQLRQQILDKTATDPKMRQLQDQFAAASLRAQSVRGAITALDTAYQNRKKLLDMEYQTIADQMSLLIEHIADRHDATPVDSPAIPRTRQHRHFR
jgi:hypothetical protein